MEKSNENQVEKPTKIRGIQLENPNELVAAVRFKDKQAVFLRARMNEKHQNASDILRGIVDLYIAMAENFPRGAFQFLKAEKKTDTPPDIPAAVTKTEILAQTEAIKTAGEAERARIRIETEKQITAEKARARNSPFRRPMVDWGTSAGVDTSGSLAGEN